MRTIAKILGSVSSCSSANNKTKLSGCSTKNPILQSAVRKTFATVSNTTVAYEEPRNKYWQDVKAYENVSEDDFLSYRWQVSHYWGGVKTLE